MSALTKWDYEQRLAYAKQENAALTARVKELEECVRRVGIGMCDGRTKDWAADLLLGTLLGHSVSMSEIEALRAVESER